MTTIEPIQYKFAVNVKMSQVPAKTPFSDLFPHVEDLVISSRKFEKFEEAIARANKLITGMTAALNVAVDKQQFKMVSEINPRFSGKPTISQEWMLNEVAKLWIVDEARSKMDKQGGMRAVALTQLLEVPGDPVPLS